MVFNPLKKSLKTFCCSVLLLHGFSCFAQEPVQLEEALANMNQSTENRAKSNIHSLQSLSKEIVPTIYIKNNEISLTNKQSLPVRIITDAASLNRLYTNNKSYSSVELICIQINTPEELQVLVNISALQGFDQLKYIYFLCTFDVCNENEAVSCEKEKIKKLFSATNSPIKIIYTIEVSE